MKGCRLRVLWNNEDTYPVSRVSSHDLPRLPPREAVRASLSTMATQTELFDAATSRRTLVVRGLAGDAIALVPPPRAPSRSFRVGAARGRSRTRRSRSRAAARGSTTARRSAPRAARIASRRECCARAWFERRGAAKPPERRRRGRDTARWRTRACARALVARQADARGAARADGASTRRSRVVPVAEAPARAPTAPRQPRAQAAGTEARGKYPRWRWRRTTSAWRANVAALPHDLHAIDPTSTDSLVDLRTGSRGRGPRPSLRNTAGRRRGPAPS